MRGRLVAQVEGFDDRPGRVVEQLVVDALDILAPHPKADRAGDVIDDLGDPGARVSA